MSIIINWSSVIQYVFGIFIVVITTFISLYIKNKINRENLEFWANKAVVAAEQIHNGDGLGGIKKDFVKAFLADMGFVMKTASLSDKVNIAIESAVMGLKILKNK